MRLALLALLMLAGPNPVARPSIELHISPLVAFAPAVVGGWAKVTDPGAALACSEVLWTWGDGCTSKRVPECDPYALHEDAPREWILHAPRHTYISPGEWLIQVEVSNGRVRVAATQVVQIMSGIEG